MTTTLNYDANGRYSANRSIDNFILGRQAADYKHVFIKDEAVPYCDKTNRRICSPVMPTLIDERADRMVRAKNEHEAGHGRLTPCDKKPEWSKTMGMLVNVLEDLRIERGVSVLSKAFEEDLKFLNRELIGKINAKMVSGTMKPKAVDEAIMALHFEGNGCSVQWQMSGTARVLYEIAKPDFDKWADADFMTEDGFYTIVKIAETIIANWEKLMQNSDNGEGEGESDQDGQGDGQGDQKQNSKSNGKSKSKKQSKQSKQESQDGNGQGDAEGEGDQEGEGQGNGQGDADQDKQDGQGGKGGQDKSEKSEDEGEKSESKDGKSTEQADTEDEADQDEDEGGEKTAQAPSKVDQDNCGTADGDSEDCGNGKIDLDQMTDGQGAMDTEIQEEFKGFQSEAKDLFGGYTAYTDEDEIIRAKEERSRFEDAYNAIHGKIAGLSSHLEQTLRTKMRCRTIGNRERGGLDVKHIANIAKSMTRNIFAQQVKGMSVKNTAVTILIDESGSIGWTCQEFQKLCVAFSEVFDRIGIKFEILGHTTGSYRPQLHDEDELSKVFTRYKPIRIFEHKNFNESYKSEKYRIGSIGSFNCNIDGDVLLTAFRRINDQKAERRIVFVLSDGQPNANQRGGNNRFFKHLKQVTDFCRANGTEVYAFGIGTREPEQFYGTENFVYIASTDEIGGQFFRSLSDILIEGGMKQGR